MNKIYLSVYYLPEGKHNGSENVNIPLPHLKKVSLKVKVEWPSEGAMKKSE